MKKFPKKIIGERVILRYFRTADAAALKKHLSDPAISRWTLHIPYPYSLADGKAFIKRNLASMKKGDQIGYVITLKGKDELIGSVGLRGLDSKENNAVIGYWLAKPFWGQGIMTEAAGLILKLGFKKLKLHRIHSSAFADNKASQKVLKKSGLKVEGRLREHRLRKGKWRDVILFGILAKEYHG